MRGTMTPHDRTLRAAATTAAAALLLTGCAGTASSDLTPSVTPEVSASTNSTATPPARTASTTPGSTPAATSADGADPDAVADAVARTMWASDATTDATPGAAAARAVQWMTPAYAAIATEPLPGGGGADWLELVEHQGRLVTDVLDADDAVPDRPADSPSAATRVRLVTLTPTGAGGWTGEPRQLLATMTLTRQGRAWLVDAITVDEVQGVDDDMQDFG